jgi:hypothetical protein
MNVPVKDWKFLCTGKDKGIAPKIFYQIFRFTILALDFFLDTGFFCEVKSTNKKDKIEN